MRQRLAAAAQAAFAAGSALAEAPQKKRHRGRWIVFALLVAGGAVAASPQGRAKVLSLLAADGSVA